METGRPAPSLGPAIPFIMRLAIKICVTLLLSLAVAESQEPQQAQQPTTPGFPAQRRPRPRPQRPMPQQLHPDDPWSPDPPPEGGVVTPPPQRYIPAAATAPAPAPAAITAPAAQPGPVQQAEDLGPAAAPQVAYRNGELTIRAINSTLESVLIAIRNKAGVQFEGLEGGASERIAVNMGPLPEGEVLAAILAGSRYDFIVVERPDSPGVVQRVLLSARKGSTAATAQGAPMQPASRPAGGDEEENPDEVSAEPESPQDTAARPPIMQAQPQMQINPQPPQPQPGQQPTGPKTPEQLLEELKQMQQRQQQQQPPPQQQSPLKQQPPL